MTGTETAVYVIGACHGFCVALLYLEVIEKWLERLPDRVAYLLLRCSHVRKTPVGS